MTLNLNVGNEDSLIVNCGERCQYSGMKRDSQLSKEHEEVKS